MMKRILTAIVLAFLLSLPCRAAWDSDPISENAAKIRSLLRQGAGSPLDPLTGTELEEMLAQFCSVSFDGRLPPSPVSRLTLCQALSESERPRITGPVGDETRSAADIVTRAEGAAAVIRRFSPASVRIEKPAVPASSCAESRADNTADLSGCCLIGHSHAVGMQMTLGLDGMDVMAVNGMSAVGALASPDFPLPDGSVGYLSDGLRMRHYQTVYLLLGTNDMPGGIWNLPRYIDSMRSIIKMVKASQPGARIILLSVAPVGAMYAQGWPEIAEDVIPAYNRALKSLSRDCCVDYLDIYTALADEHDLIRAEYGNGVDGLHFNPQGYQAILDVMLEHY